MGIAKLLPRLLRRHVYPAKLQRQIYGRILRDADLVLCHFGPVGRRAALALQDEPRPRLWTIFHGYDLSSFVQECGREIYAPLFKRGDQFLAVSRLWMDRLKELGCPQDRIRLQRTGIQVDRVPSVERKMDATLRILSVSRLVEKKGIEYALRALAEFARWRPSVNWSYEIIGEGPLRNSLGRLARNLGIDDRVNFAGELPAETVQAKVAVSDVFMLPSVTARDGDMEGIPVSLMEAMAAGVSVLSTYHSGIPELIEHCVSGLLAPERDHVKLAYNICRLIDEPHLRSAFVRAARKKIEQEFNQMLLLDKLAADIRMLAPSRPNTSVERPSN
jgi:colanic acid/amylovoran biosynthesis glycosyltransferase